MAAGLRSAGLRPALAGRNKTNVNKSKATRCVVELRMKILLRHPICRDILPCAYVNFIGVPKPQPSGKASAERQRLPPRQSASSCLPILCSCPRQPLRRRSLLGCELCWDRVGGRSPGGRAHSLSGAPFHPGRAPEAVPGPVHGELLICPEFCGFSVSCYDEEMRDLVILFVHLITTLVRLAGPGGVRSVVVMVEYKDLATLEQNEDKADALLQKMFGGDEKVMQGYKERSEIREVLGTRLAREIILEPKK